MLQGLEELVIRFYYLESSEEKIEELADLLKAFVKDACGGKEKIEVQVIAQFIAKYDSE